MGKKVYLSGGIFGLSEEQAMGWRKVARIILENHGFEVIDPMRRHYRVYNYDIANEIVQLDKKDILESDIVLVKATAASWGTVCELMYASMNNKIIVAYTEKDNAVNFNPWLFHHSTKIVAELEQATHFIIQKC